MELKPRIERSDYFAPLETVRIDHPDVPTGVVINATDFDPATHVRFGEKPAPVADDSKGAKGAK